MTSPACACGGRSSPATTRSNLPLAVQQELTPRQREILQMRFTGGMSITGIAKELGLNKSTVSRSLTRSVERLYRSLRYSL